MPACISQEQVLLVWRSLNPAVRDSLINAYEQQQRRLRGEPQDSYVTGETFSEEARKAIERNPGVVSILYSHGKEGDERVANVITEAMVLLGMERAVFNQSFVAHAGRNSCKSGKGATASFVGVIVREKEYGELVVEFHGGGGCFFARGSDVRRPLTHEVLEKLAKQCETGKTSEGEPAVERPALAALINNSELLSFEWEDLVQAVYTGEPGDKGALVQVSNALTGQSVESEVKRFGMSGPWVMSLFAAGGGAAVRLGVHHIVIVVLGRTGICIIALFFALYFSICGCHPKIDKSGICLTRFGEIEMHGARAGSRERAMRARASPAGARAAERFCRPAHPRRRPPLPPAVSRRLCVHRPCWR